MDPDRLLELARAEQARALGIVAGLQPCPIVLSRATTLLGSFSVDMRTKQGTIRISRYLTDSEQARDTIRHELAHQAAHDLHGHLGHGPAWRMWARYIGCVPKACSAAGVDPDVTARRQRYVVGCGRCGWRTTRQRRSTIVRQPRRYACARCNGPLSVTTVGGPAP